MILPQSAFAWPGSRTARPLGPTGVVASIERSTPDAPNAWVGQSGKASYYGPSFDGRQSASGARFDQTALTAAHAWLPFGTKVKVTLAGSDLSGVVTITDRMSPGRRVLGGIRYRWRDVGRVAVSGRCHRALTPRAEPARLVGMQPEPHLD